MSSEAGLSIKIGKVTEQENREVSKIEIKSHMTKHEVSCSYNSKVEDFYQKWQTKFNRSTPPFLTFELPEYFPAERVPFLAEQLQKVNGPTDFKIETVKKQESNFYLIDFIDPNQKEAIFIKKLSKVFSDLSTVKKEVFAEVEFYDIGKRLNQFKAQGKRLAPWSVLFENCFIRTWVDLSKQFWQLFLKLVEKISPKFANSPLLAVLPLMERLSLDLTLDSVNELGENVTVMFMGKADEQLYKLVKDKKGKLNVYISFEQMGYLEISIDTTILAVLHFEENQ